jgi:hypothetical protein
MLFFFDYYAWSLHSKPFQHKFFTNIFLLLSVCRKAGEARAFAWSDAIKLSRQERNGVYEESF